MLKAIRQLFGGTGSETVQNVANLSSSPGIAGYFMPRTVAELLDTPSRKQCLQQLWENSALPKDLYEHFCLQPLKHLIMLMQVLPANGQGEYAWEGGLADVTLQTTTFAVRLAKGHMLPPGADPEDQSAQNVQWNVVVFYAALWHYLPLLSQMEGELQSGRAWLPGLTVPGEPYRFRFRVNPSAPALTTGQSGLIAARLIPAEVIDWLSTLPSATQSLMLIASRQSSALPAIDDIVQEAVKLARGDLLVLAPVAGTLSAPLTTMVQIQNTTGSALPSVPAVDIQRSVSSSPAVESVVLKASVADVLLNSALDAPVNDKPLAGTLQTPETIAGAEEDMQALLSLMAEEGAVPVTLAGQGFCDASQVEAPVSAESSVSTPEVTQVVENAEISRESDVIAARVPAATHEFCVPQPFGNEPARPESRRIVEAEGGSMPPGEIFWRWLGDGLSSDEIPINTVGARVHLVSGFVFITVPGIFYLYLKQSGLEGDQRAALQEDFERLEKHRRVKGKRFYFAHLYESSDHTGSFQRTKGYLIKASLLYRGKVVSADSPVLVIP